MVDWGVDAAIAKHTRVLIGETEVDIDGAVTGAEPTRDREFVRVGMHENFVGGPG